MRDARLYQEVFWSFLVEASFQLAGRLMSRGSGQRQRQWSASGAVSSGSVQGHAVPPGAVGLTTECLGKTW